MAKKSNLEKEILNDLKKENRGVKKGTKRNPYKKKSKINGGINNNPVNNSGVSIPKNNVSEIREEGVAEPIKQTVQRASGESKYEKFLSDYSSTEPLQNESVQTSEVKNDEQTFDFTRNQNNNTVQQPELQKLKENSSVLINGYMLLALCDFIVPTVMLYIYKMVDERANQIKVSDLKLDADQKNALMESANICARYIFEKINPLVAFFLCMGVCYGTNIQSALEVIPKIEKKNLKPNKK